LVRISGVSVHFSRAYSGSCSYSSFLPRRFSRLVPSFLEEDIFAKGLQPGLLVQCVHVHVDHPAIELNTPSSHLPTNMQRRMYMERAANPPDGHSLLLFDKLSSTLSQIKNKNVNLYIRIRCYPDLLCLHQALERLGPVVYQLHKEGFGRIRVQRTTGHLDYTYLFDGQETLFNDRLVRRWMQNSDLTKV
jgi:hypothetical protein